MAVFLNGIAQLEYDRNKLMPDHQAAYLEADVTGRSGTAGSVSMVYS